jgi:hypothetical protein
MGSALSDGCAARSLICLKLDNSTSAIKVLRCARRRWADAVRNRGFRSWPGLIQFIPVACGGCGAQGGRAPAVPLAGMRGSAYPHSPCHGETWTTSKLPPWNGSTGTAPGAPIAAEGVHYCSESSEKVG